MVSVVICGYTPAAAPRPAAIAARLLAAGWVIRHHLRSNQLKLVGGQAVTPFQHPPPTSLLPMQQPGCTIYTPRVWLPPALLCQHNPEDQLLSPCTAGRAGTCHLHSKLLQLHAPGRTKLVLHGCSKTPSCYADAHTPSAAIQWRPLTPQGFTAAPASLPCTGRAGCQGPGPHGAPAACRSPLRRGSPPAGGLPRPGTPASPLPAAEGQGGTMGLVWGGEGSGGKGGGGRRAQRQTVAMD
jgi:hypothetical protein